MPNTVPDRSQSPRRIPTTLERREELARLLAAARRDARTDPDAAVAAADRAVELAGELDDRELLVAALRQRGLCRIARGAYREALADLRPALRMLDEADEPADGAEIALAIGHARLGLHDHGGAIAAYDDALRRSDRVEDLEMSAVAHTALGNVHGSLGDHPSAVRHHRAALALRDRAGEADPRLLAVICSDVGVGYLRMGSHEQAREFFERAAQLAREGADRYLEACALANLGGAWLAAGNVEAARELVIRALLLHEQLRERRGVAETMITLATIDAAVDPAGALRLYRSAASLAETCGDAALASAALSGIGAIRLGGGEGWEAIADVERALTLAVEAGDRAAESRAHELLAAAYEELGDHGSALRHFKEFSSLKTSIEGGELRREASEIVAREIIEGKDRELERERRAGDELRRELEHKTTELASLAVSMVRKQEMLDAIREHGGRAADGMAASALAGRFEVAEPSAAAGEAARELERADRLNPDFMRRLKERFPRLTATELRICTLLRNDMSTKEIADMLCTSERTVENHRYRMRKKMDLPPDEHLPLFLATF